MRPDTKARAFFAEIFDPTHAISANDPDGRLLGIAGFKTAKGALTGAGLADLARHYGWIGATWRGVLLQLLERPIAGDQLLMDGIFVRREARGLGVGSALLAAVCKHAESLDLSCVRLDVIDSNPRARALYEREGFVAVEEHQLGPLKPLFGFSSATTMHKQL